VLQSHVKVITANEQSLLQAALAHLVNQGYPAVNIVTDEPDLTVFETYVQQINLVIFCNHQKIYPVISGFRKWKPAGETISVLNLNSQMQTQGLQQTAPQQYQTLADGFFSLKFQEEYLFIGEEY
jgi:thiamine pyrophosphokinase